MLKNWIGLILMSMVLLLGMPSHAASGNSELSTYRKYVYARLLTANDGSRIKLGAKGIEYDGGNDVELSDLAAKVLWEYGAGGRQLDDDTAAWLARALGATQSRRYEGLLKQIATLKPGKIAGYANESLTKLTRTGHEFGAEDVDIDTVRQALTYPVQTNPTNTASLFELSTGMWIEDVFNKLGYPDDVGVIPRARRVPYIGHVKFTNLMLIYKDKGSLEFSHDNSDWYVAAIVPRSLVMQPTRSNNNVGAASVSPATDEIAQGLLSASPALFRSTATYAYRNNAFDEPTLDIAAWRLVVDMKNTDKDVIDGLAHLAHLLGNARNTRYHDVLVTVSNNAGHRKVRSYAKLALESMPLAETEQFKTDTRPTARQSK